jgi:hypothetical protein
VINSILLHERKGENDKKQKKTPKEKLEIIEKDRRVEKEECK